MGNIFWQPIGPYRPDRGRPPLRDTDPTEVFITPTSPKTQYIIIIIIYNLTLFSLLVLLSLLKLFLRDNSSNNTAIITKIIIVIIIIIIIINLHQPPSTSIKPLNILINSLGIFENHLGRCSPRSRSSHGLPGLPSSERPERDISIPWASLGPALQGPKPQTSCARCHGERLDWKCGLNKTFWWF